MTTVNKFSIGIVAGLMLATFLLMFAIFDGQSKIASGSVTDGQGYMGTTTSTGTFTSPSTVRTGAGIFGSVVITGAATGIVNIYDATTTNISLRAASKATSTLVLATFPASAAAGTYTFDRNFNDGLIIDVIGTSPTTTVTWK